MPQFGERPIDSQHMKDALAQIAIVMEMYDLSGTVCLINEKEWSYAYKFPSTWNANVQDADTPLGFRIRAREAELGADRAEQLLTGSAFVLTSLQDFGNQTRLWAADMIKMVKKVGLHISYRPFNGHKLTRLVGIDMRDR